MRIICVVCESTIEEHPGGKATPGLDEGDGLGCVGRGGVGGVGNERASCGSDTAGQVVLVVLTLKEALGSHEGRRHAFVLLEPNGT